MVTERWSTTPSSSGARTKPLSAGARGALALIALGLVAALGIACSSEPSDQRRINTAMVGATDTLSDTDSETVSAIGVELVALAQPLEAWFDETAPRSELLAEMSAAVERIRARLTPERSPAVRSTFDPYVTAWVRILDALETDDQAQYDAALARIRELDDRRIERVATAFGEERARELLESDRGVGSNR